jgi:hypothetical protein
MILFTEHDLEKAINLRLRVAGAAWLMADRSNQSWRTHQFLKFGGPIGHAE